MTLYTVGLQSTKKIDKADFVVGVEAAAGGGEPVFIKRRVDPRKSHPLFMTNVLDKVKDVDLDSRAFNRYDFQAVVHHHGLRTKPEYCYEDPERAYVRCSGELPSFIRRLDADEVQATRDGTRRTVGALGRHPRPRNLSSHRTVSPRLWDMPERRHAR